MKQKRTDCILLGISTGSFLLMSISFLLMPFASGIAPGLLFWGGLTIGAALQIVLEVRRRAFFAAYHIKRKKMQKPRNGLLTFGSNQAAMIVDGILIASILATVLAFILTEGYGFVCYVCIAIMIFSFCLHCILNGRLYFHAKNQIKIRHVLEQKTRILRKKGEGNDEDK